MPNATTCRRGQVTCVQVQTELPTGFVPRQRFPSRPSAKTARVCGETGKPVARGAQVRRPPTRWKALHVDPPAARVLIHSAASVPRTKRFVSPLASLTAAGATVERPPIRRQAPVHSQTAWSAPRAKTSWRLVQAPLTAGTAEGSEASTPPRDRHEPPTVFRQSAESRPRTYTSSGCVLAPTQVALGAPNATPPSRLHGSHSPRPSE